MTDGICKPGFERVAEAFQKNFDRNGEVGASVCLTAGGETVIDLWGGVADPKTNAPWTKDTGRTRPACTSQRARTSAKCSGGRWTALP